MAYKCAQTFLSSDQRLLRHTPPPASVCSLHPSLQLLSVADTGVCDSSPPVSHVGFHSRPSAHAALINGRALLPNAASSLQSSFYFIHLNNFTDLLIRCYLNTFLTWPSKWHFLVSPTVSLLRWCSFWASPTSKQPTVRGSFSSLLSLYSLPKWAHAVWQIHCHLYTNNSPIVHHYPSLFLSAVNEKSRTTFQLPRCLTNFFLELFLLQSVVFCSGLNSP